MKRTYYSVRTNRNRNFSKFSLDTLRRLFINLYQELCNDGYFQQAFGYDCVDNGFIHGSLGENIGAKVYRLLRKDNLWPICEKAEYYSEDDMFDMIEFLYDNVSKPIKTRDAYHAYSQCGWHFSEFSKKDGQKEFLAKINEILNEYSNGFEINKKGQILIKDDNGLSAIYSADIPTDRADVKTKIDLAVQKYRQSRSSLEERRIAIRELADVLEALRPEAKLYLSSKDEGDLFNIANNFTVRHFDDKQKINFDRDIWYSWMFYFYLSTIHVLLRAKERKNNKLL